MRLCVITAATLVLCLLSGANAETLRHPETLESLLKSVSIDHLAQEAQRRGDAQRGALVFYKSAASCVKCHGTGDASNPLGPDLATVGKDASGKPVTDQHLIESLLYPSRSIRSGYETINVLTDDGMISGMLVEDRKDEIVLREANNLAKEIAIDKDDIEAQRVSKSSMMPEGLVATLPNQRDFYDLIKYVTEVARGGPERAAQLKPSPEDLIVVDDSVDLDHAGIIKKLRSRDFDTGKQIYHGYCFNCHGNDGNTPSLPTARAFGTQKLKFGSDPYAMFMTLTRGNGLMAPMSHLTPKERYQVVHYIREAFMKDANSDYVKVSKDYLAGLPKGTQNGTYVKVVQRDYGPALASQLQRKFSSVLSIDLDGMTISYNLNSMDQAGIWRDGFLDLSETQHARNRGEGTANPKGKMLDALAGWGWGHESTMDYPREGLLKRGPLPGNWMQYRGHHLHDNQVILDYSVDGRSVLETPSKGAAQNSVVHEMEIGAGDEILLCVASPSNQDELTPRIHQIKTITSDDGKIENADASETMAALIDKDGGFVATTVQSNSLTLKWKIDDKKRILLTIPQSEKTHVLKIARGVGETHKELLRFAANELAAREKQPTPRNPRQLIGGGEQLWPQVLTTVGYRGLESGGYALDTITIPQSTPWNTWFRTSALDFFPDGRMALATYGGDVWIVSGIDDELLELKWKRFAGGLYEPFGLKVVDNKIYVTCKDRLTRLHDTNGDGEADFYESFHADPDVSVNFHAFNFDLQTDTEGNFYYAKSGHGGDSFIPGCVVQVTADGQQRSVYCTGFRTPNGMGALPDGRVTASDNQGQWTPAGKISLLKPGGFYGWVNNYSIPGMWEPGEGTIDLDKVVPPDSFDPPLVWMPQEFDNSSGGQLFVDDPRWGPLSGRLLHTSFGKGWMSYLMMQDFGDVAQAAIIKLPFDFQTGIMRARVNPGDGQVYATGLQGWNGGGRAGLLGHGVQRLRYTGKPVSIVSDCQVEADGLRLSFNFELDKETAEDLASYVANHWNYKWQKSYGSDQYSPSTGQKGADKLKIVSAKLSDDRKSVKLNVPNIAPVHQIHLLLNLKSDSGDPFTEEIYWTINRVPK